MRKVIVPLLLLPALGLGGCAALSGRNATPDEFAVVRNAPLIIPPDYMLAPPVAGTAAITAGDSQAQAIDVLFGGPAPRSSAETSMLERAGRDRATVGARSTAGDPETRVVDKGPVTATILATAQGDSSVAASRVPQ